MPPNMSDNERIPKRGRPSKKIAQNNLKFKRPEKSSIAEHVEKKEKVQIKDVPATISELVSTYTISDSGRMKKVDLKVKENKKNKVRAEAFQSLLDQIAQNTKSITTPVGVVNIPAPPKLMSLSSSTIPTTSTIPTVSTPRRMNREDVAVVEGLAKQYKISSSIIDRHLDAAPNPKKIPKNLKKIIDEITQEVSSTVSKSPEVNSLISSSILTNSLSSTTVSKITQPFISNVQKVRGSITLHDKALHGSNLKLKMPSANPVKDTEFMESTNSLNGLADNQNNSDVVTSKCTESTCLHKVSKTKKKAKKSKKKKKKEKKAKSKELKKELKRLKKEKKKAKRKKNKDKSENKKSEKKLKKLKSNSSFDQNVTDIVLPFETTNEVAKADSLEDIESNNGNSSVKSIEHVFGSNILADNKVSTFSGLKISDTTVENSNEISIKDIENSTLNFSNVDPVERFGGDQSAFKKAKIRKKKIVRRSKLDPQFLDQMDKLASLLNSTQIDSNAIQSMPPNDILDYKFLTFSNTPKVVKAPSIYKNLSVFCYAQFFQTHGWIKPPLETVPVQKSAIFVVNQDKSCFSFKEKNYKKNGSELSTFTKKGQKTAQQDKFFTDKNESYLACSSDGLDNKSNDSDNKNVVSNINDQKQNSKFFDLNFQQLKGVNEKNGQSSNQPVDVDLLKHLKAAFDKNLIEGKITSDVLNTTFNEAVKQYKINNKKSPETYVAETSKFLINPSNKMGHIDCEPEVKLEKTTVFPTVAEKVSIQTFGEFVTSANSCESKRASKTSRGRKRSTCSNIISINNRGKKVLQVPPLNIHSFSKSSRKNLSFTELEYKKKSLEEVVKKINKGSLPCMDSKTLNKASLVSMHNFNKIKNI